MRTLTDEKFELLLNELAEQLKKGRTPEEIVKARAEFILRLALISPNILKGSIEILLENEVWAMMKVLEARKEKVVTE